MNIRYLGSRDCCTDGDRIAYISFDEKKEKELVERFVDVIVVPFFTEKFSFEEECLAIPVDDKEEYDNLKELWLRFKRYDIKGHLKKYDKFLQEWKDGILTTLGLYDKVERDLDLYLALIHSGYREHDIEQVMYSVSGAKDAYKNAIGEYAEVLMK